MNPPESEVIAQVRAILATKILDCPIEEVTDSAVSNLDSIGRITLLVELENDFEVELTGEEYDVQIFTSVDKLARFVIERKAKKANLS